VHHAIEWDTFLGSATRGSCGLTLGGVRMNKAYVDANRVGPEQHGDIREPRRLPQIAELNFSRYVDMEVYAGLGRVMFGRKARPIEHASTSLRAWTLASASATF